MIEQQLIDMLDDPNPQVRTNAVKQLAKTKSQEAVQYLAVVYKTDSDPEIRELARKAGLYIKKKMTEDKWTGGDPDPDAIDDEPAEIVEEIIVSPRAIESSKGNMDTAMNLHVSGDDEKAAKFVERAFTANPNLKNDPYYLGMASTILGIPGNQVAEYLLGDVEYDAKGKPKRKRKSKNIEDDVSTETVIIDLVIFWIVLATIFIIGTLVLFQLLSGVFDSAQFSSEFSASEYSEAEMEAYLGAFLGVGVIGTIIYGFINSILSVIMLLIQFAIYHFAATSIMGGEGTFKRLIHRLTNFYTLMYAGYSIVAFIAIYLFFNTSPSLNSPDQISSSAGILSVLYPIAFLVGIALTFYMGHLIGKTYDFGMVKGCVTMIVAWVIMMAFGCACSFAISATIGQMMTNVMLSAGG